MSRSGRAGEGNATTTLTMCRVKYWAASERRIRTFVWSRPVDDPNHATGTDGLGLPPVSGTTLGFCAVLSRPRPHRLFGAGRFVFYFSYPLSLPFASWLSGSGLSRRILAAIYTQHQQYLPDRSASAEDARFHCAMSPTRVATRRFLIIIITLDYSQQTLTSPTFLPHTLPPHT